jgi:hypothetical protein
MALAGREVAAANPASNKNRKREFFIPADPFAG